MDFPTELISAGNLAATTLFMCSTTGLHRVAVYVAPVSVNALAAVTAQVNWTDEGTLRTWTSTALSLANLNANNYISVMFPVRADAGTAITAALTVTGSSGSFTASFGVRPPR